jgi:zinc and cadmium transporter
MSPFAEALVLLALAGTAGGMPLVRSWSHRGLHVLASVAAGLLLGTVFLHLLPELSGSLPDEGPGSRAPWVVGLAGFLALFFVEKVWLERRNGDSHRVVWYACYTGLSLHAAVAGLALALVFDHGSATWPILIAILLHKIGESFSLATVMRLAGLQIGRLVVFLLLFALITPAGMLVGRNLLTPEAGHDLIVEGFACGTFLYVAACDLLPEVFHGEGARWQQGLGVVAGVAAVAIGEFLL